MAEAPKLTPHQRIMRAAKARRGVRLSAAEVASLAKDEAISACAANDDEAISACAANDDEAISACAANDDEVILPCLCCGKAHGFAPTSREANGEFNVFCDGECEDRYAARL